MRPAALALWLCAACTSEGTLVVQVRTDLAPGQDFDRVEATIDGIATTVRADEARAWGHGVRVAELAVPEGRRRARVAAYRDGALVVGRALVVEVRGLTVSTVFLTRACQGVVCPGPGDAAEATACVAGRCQVEGCTEETPEACAPAACDACPAATGCAVGECTASAGCFVTLDHAACAEGSWCAPDGSCEAPSTCAPIAGADLALTADWRATCVTSSDRTPRCFGHNSFRHPVDLGDEIATPTEVHPEVTFRAMHLGDDFACGILDDGRLACWGETAYGMLADGVEAPGGTHDLVFPSVAAPDHLWVGGHAFCVEAGGETLCAGKNLGGQLGIGTLVNSPIPAPHPGRYAQLDLGQFHGCGVRADGTLHCWGDNVDGGLAHPMLGSFPTPAQVGTATDWVRVDVGNTVTAAIRADGTVWTWGQREHVGREWVVDAHVPAPIAWDGALPARDIAMGHNHGCAIFADGQLVCWGADWCEQAGNPEAMTDAQMPFEPFPGRRFADVAVGQCHTCALTEAGRLFCWGSNDRAQLGDPSLGPDDVAATPREVCVGP